MAYRKLATVALAALVVSLGACSKPPKEGSPCATKGDVKCVDKTTAVICASGKFEKLTCDAPIGCMTVAGTGSCTHASYAVGEPCLEEGKPDCSGDHKSMIKCEGDHWKLVNTCAGVLGCVSNAEGTKCDLGAAAPGSACTKENEGNASCTPDAKSLLICKAGKMTIAATCKGTHGCRQLGTQLTCDETISDLGDVCDSSEYEGKFGCTPDKKMRVVCKKDKMVKDRACNCSVMIDKVSCN